MLKLSRQNSYNWLLKSYCLFSLQATGSIKHDAKNILIFGSEILKLMYFYIRKSMRCTRNLIILKVMICLECSCLLCTYIMFQSFSKIKTLNHPQVKYSREHCLKKMIVLSVFGGVLNSSHQEYLTHPTTQRTYIYAQLNLYVLFNKNKEQLASCHVLKLWLRILNFTHQTSSFSA